MDFDEVASKVLQGGSELVELKADIRQLLARVDRDTLVSTQGNVVVAGQLPLGGIRRSPPARCCTKGGGQGLSQVWEAVER